MNEKYLTIITTVLVVTQIVRIVQNTINLKRQNLIIKRQLREIEDITQKDLETQKQANALIVAYLKDKVSGDEDEYRE